MPQRGDVALARFPYTSQAGGKLRPVLVLVQVPGRYPDFLVMFISSQLGQAVPGLDLVLDPAQPAFRATGLKVASVLRIAKVTTLSGGLLAGTLGQLDMAVFADVVRRLNRLIRTGHS